MASFLSDPVALQLLEQLLERYAASRDPEAANTLEKLTAAESAVAELQTKVLRRDDKLKARDERIEKIEDQLRSAQKNSNELVFVKDQWTSCKAMIDLLSSENKVLISEKSSFEQNLRTTISKEHEGEKQRLRESNLAEIAVFEHKLANVIETNGILETQLAEMSLLNNNASLKGGEYERVIMDEIENTLGIEVKDMSKQAKSTDLRVTLFEDCNVFVDTKNYGAKVLPSAEVAKFERDRAYLKNIDETARGFLLMTTGGIPNAHRYKYIGDNLFKHGDNTYIITKNNTQALYKALFLVARDATSSTTLDTTVFEQRDYTNEFNNIIQRMIPLFSNNTNFMNELKKLLKSHDMERNADGAALYETVEACEIDGLQTTKLFTAIGCKKRKR